MDEERRYAELRLLEDLLPVIDNINRAIEAAEKNADSRPSRVVWPWAFAIPLLTTNALVCSTTSRYSNRLLAK